MPYCTVEDLISLVDEETVKQLTDDEDVGVINQSRVDKAIADAGAEIDAWLATRYTVPLASTPAVINKCAVDIAIYNLYSRRVEKMPEVRSDRHKNAVKVLENVSKGVIALGVTPAPQQSPDSSGAAYSGGDRRFTREKLKNF